MPADGDCHWHIGTLQLGPCHVVIVEIPVPGLPAPLVALTLSQPGSAQPAIVLPSAGHCTQLLASLQKSLDLEGSLVSAPGFRVYLLLRSNHAPDVAVELVLCLHGAQALWNGTVQPAQAAGPVHVQRGTAQPSSGPAVFPAAYDPAGASPLQADNLTPAQRCVAARVSHTEDKIGRLFYTRERSSMAVLTFAKCLELLNQMEAPSATDPADPKWSKLVTALTKSLDWAAPKSCSDKTPRARAVRALRGMLQCMLGTESQSSTLELASQAINGENNIVRQLEAWGVKSDVFNGMSSNTRFKSEPRKALAAKLLAALQADAVSPAHVSAPSGMLHLMSPVHWAMSAAEQQQSQQQNSQAAAAPTHTVPAPSAMQLPPAQWGTHAISNPEQQSQKQQSLEGQFGLGLSDCQASLNSEPSLSGSWAQVIKGRSAENFAAESQAESRRQQAVAAEDAHDILPTHFAVTPQL